MSLHTDTAQVLNRADITTAGIDASDALTEANTALYRLAVALETAGLQFSGAEIDLVISHVDMLRQTVSDTVARARQRLGA